jgi:hypothetical protein
MVRLTTPQAARQDRLFVPPLPRPCKPVAPLERPTNSGYIALVRARLGARREGRAA